MAALGRCVGLSGLVVPVLAAACGTKIAQTAEPRASREDAGAIVATDAGDAASTRCTAQTSALPADPQWGGGDTVQPNLLVSNSYVAGEGPGIYVASTGGFRLYVNGLLLATGTTAGQASFVPFTFVPGDNVVALVATNTVGPPAALIHVDELEKPYLSASIDWKASTDPAGNWRSVDYDDAAWTAATDRGSFGTLPGCDPVSVFPGDSTAHWIGAAEPSAGAVALRFHLRVAAVGFAAGTTGGGTAAPATVETWQELADATAGNDPRVVLVPEGLMDLRPAGTEVRQQMTCPTPCTDDPTKFAYNVVIGTFTCALPAATLPRTDRQITVGSNKTIVGLGRGSLLRGVSFLLDASQEVILRNLAIYDVNPSMIEAGDGVTIGGGDHLWLDHLTFRWISDGFDDIAAGSTHITASWLHYDGRNELECGGLHVRTAQVTSATVTFHHDWFDTVNGRAPLVTDDMAQVHLFNDVWNDNPSYAVGSACTAQVLLEASYLENVQIPTLEEGGDTCTNMLGLIDARSGSNVYGPGVGMHRQGGNSLGEPHDAVFTPPYDYVVDPAATVNALVRARAGAGSRWALPVVRN